MPTTVGQAASPMIPASTAGLPDGGAGARYQGVRALVLGASGFIGRWVAQALSNAEASVVLVVRDAAAAAPVLRRWGIRGDVIQADLLDVDALRRVCRAARPSITFNLAGYGIDPLERDAATAEAVNVRLVGELATVLAEDPNPAWTGLHLVHAGSALEYGDVAGVLAEDGPTNPTTLYGQTKLRGTERLQRVCQGSGLRAVTARLFMVYGTGEQDGRLLPHLIAGAAGEAVLRFTSGEQRRDFTYVEDVADGMLRLGLSGAGAGEPVNLATGRMSRVRDVIETAARQLGIRPERLGFGALPTRPEEMNRVAGVAIDTLRRLTEWAPPTGVEEGIRRTLERRRELEGVVSPRPDAPRT